MFAVLIAARELKAKERAEFMHELVAIAAVPGAASLEYKKSLESFYRNIFEQAVPEHQSQKQNKGAMPFDVASNIMFDAMKQKKRLECGQ